MTSNNIQLSRKLAYQLLYEKEKNNEIVIHNYEADSHHWHVNFSSTSTKEGYVIHCKEKCDSLYLEHFNKLTHSVHFEPITEEEIRRLLVPRMREFIH